MHGTKEANRRQMVSQSLSNINTAFRKLSGNPVGEDARLVCVDQVKIESPFSERRKQKSEKQ